MSRGIRGLGILVIVVGASLTGVAAAAAQPAREHAAHLDRGPRIVARPGTVTVNTRVRLSGSGFAAHRRLTIWECTARTWVVPQQVCNHRNVVDLTTNGAGRFNVSQVALVCPLRTHVMTADFARTCYVGMPTVRGIDTVALVGAARITVTGP